MRSTLKYSIYLLVALLLATSGLSAQQGEAAGIHGHVSDQDGAVIPGAVVIAKSASGKNFTTKSDGLGAFVLGSLPADTYSIQISVQGFAPFTRNGVALQAGQSLNFNVKMAIETQQVQVEVSADSGSTLDTSPDNNASSIILKGKDLDALSDDPDELQSELQALAGPAAGPNGGQIYVDGFSAGQLPPKSAIREIRINQNPFSAQFDQLGYGRIEIFTKPGTDKFHGQTLANINEKVFNTSNPFVSNQPDYSTLQFTANVSGPINKKASFFLAGSRRNIQANNIVNATYLDYTDPTLSQVALASAFGNPQRRTDIAPRLDWQVTANNTMSIRYQFNQVTQKSTGVGGLSLPSQASDNLNLEDTVQFSDTQIFGQRQNVINEVHFQYLRDRNTTTPHSVLPNIVVSGDFNGGGNNNGFTHDAQDRYEFQDYTSIALSKNFIRFGGRVRVTRDANYSTGGSAPSSFYGQFTFSNINNYGATLCSLNGINAQDAANCATYKSLGTVGASKYTVMSGSPAVIANLTDTGLYAESDWKARPNFTLSYGLRFETQGAIHDKADFAPRVAIAWGLDGKGKTPPKTVLRAGFGVFYNRFAIGSLEQSKRQAYGSPNGEKETVLNNPTGFTLGCLAGTSACAPTSNSASTVATYYSVQSNLHAATTLQGAATVERQIGKLGTFTVNYLRSRGLHQYESESVNAGTYTNYQYSAEGIFKQNQIISNLNIRAGKNASITTFYTLNYSKANASGAAAFASDSADLLNDYGRSSFDVRNRMYVIGNITLPRKITLSPFMVLASGAPFNITTGTDINGDSIINDRPAFATAGNCYVNSNATAEAYLLKHNYCFNIAPALANGEYARIPVNYGHGPNLFTTNVRIAKSIGFGPKIVSATPQSGGDQGGDSGGGGRQGGGGGRGGGGGGMGGFGGPRGGSGGGRGGAARVNDRKYTLGFSAQIQNLFNDVDLGAPSGSVQSPKFGQSTQLSGPIYTSTTAVRRINAQLVFTF